MGQSMAAEVAFHQDRVTGVRIARMTGYPCINSCFYFHDCYWAPDSSRFLFYSIPGPRGSTAADIYRVDVNGHNLVRLTSGISWGGFALDPDGRSFYYLSEGAMWQADTETGEAHQVALLPAGAKPDASGSITWDGRVYAAHLRLASGEMGVYRVYTDRWRADVVYTEKSFSHTQIEPSAGEIIAIQRHQVGDGRSYWWLPADGGQPQPFELAHGTGHWMFVGDTQRIISTMAHPRGALLIAGPGDKEPTVVLETSIYLWHAAASRDGQWAISDSNWPDQGLQLVHLPSGRYETLCMSDSDNGAWNQVHPHPSFSPDGTMVTFTSNRTGVPQVYLARIPPEMKERLAEG